MKDMDKSVAMKLNALILTPEIVEVHNALGLLCEALALVEDNCMDEVEEIDCDLAVSIENLRGDLEQLFDN